MTNVIPFNPPNDNDDPDDGARTPIEALDYVAEMLEDEVTNAEQMVIAWSSQEDGKLMLRYIVAGEANLTGAVGLLEMTKSHLMT